MKSRNKISEVAVNPNQLLEQLTKENAWETVENINKLRPGDFAYINKPQYLKNVLNKMVNFIKSSQQSQTEYREILDLLLQEARIKLKKKKLVTEQVEQVIDVMLKGGKVQYDIDNELYEATKSLRSEKESGFFIACAVSRLPFKDFEDLDISESVKDCLIYLADLLDERNQELQNFRGEFPAHITIADTISSLPLDRVGDVNLVSTTLLSCLGSLQGLLSKEVECIRNNSKMFVATDIAQAISKLPIAKVGNTKLLIETLGQCLQSLGQCLQNSSDDSDGVADVALAIKCLGRHMNSYDNAAEALGGVEQSDSAFV